MLLSGATVVLTGATGGIGRSTGTLLAARGCQVVVVGREAAATGRLADQLGGAPVTADLRERGSAEAVVRHALDRYGRLDALVSCAGVGHAGDVAAMSPDRIDELVDVNVRAPLLLARACLAPMRAQGRGSLLFVTSLAGALGVPDESVYSATKAAVETFAEALRVEERGNGITVSTVLPGVVDTGFFAARGRPYERRIPRPMPPDRVARAIVGALEAGTDRLVVPRWLTVPIRLRALAPRSYRRLERRWG